MSNRPTFTLSMWTGVRFIPWLRVLARHGFRVAPARIPRALGITAASVGNELLSAIQQAAAFPGRGAIQIAVQHPVEAVGLRPVEVGHRRHH